MGSAFSKRANAAYFLLRLVLYLLSSSVATISRADLPKFEIEDLRLPGHLQNSLQPVTNVTQLRADAELGKGLAECRLAFCLQTGKGMAQNKTEAVKWYKRAAEHGIGLASLALGCCYTQGEGVEPDYEEAVRYFQEAVARGVPAGNHGLGLAYFAPDLESKLIIMKQWHYFVPQPIKDLHGHNWRLRTFTTKDWVLPPITPKP